MAVKAALAQEHKNGVHWPAKRQKPDTKHHQSVPGGPRPKGSETGLTPVLALDCEMVGVGREGSRSALARCVHHCLAQGCLVVQALNCTACICLVQADRTGQGKRA